VGQLIRRKRRSERPTVDAQRALEVSAQPRAMIQRDPRTIGQFDKRDRVAVQIMQGVLRAKRSEPPDLDGLDTKLRPEHKQWILLLWSAASGEKGGGAKLSIPDRHEALASGMQGALALADRYATEDPKNGNTWRVELHGALQSVRADLYAESAKPQKTPFSLGFGFVPKILLPGETKLARTGAALSDQPAELRQLVYLSFPSRTNAKTPEKWFAGLSDRQLSAFTALFNALSAKGLWGYANTIHHIDNGEPHFWGVEQEGNTVSLKVIGDTESLNKKLGDPMTQNEISLDSPFMAMMHKGQKSYRERTSGAGLHISVGPGKFWDVHIDAHPPVPGQGKESEAELVERFLMHGLEELFPNMPRDKVRWLLQKVRVPPHIAKQIANHTLPAVRFIPATDSAMWQSKNPAQIKALDVQSLRQDGKTLTATVGISTSF
jgi:hypothetical protein